MTSVFTKIIHREILSTVLYEDDQVIALLDNSPLAPGHTLVVPKLEVDKFYDLPEHIYTHLMLVCRRIASCMESVTHVHLTPLSPRYTGTPISVSDEENTRFTRILRERLAK
jgi:diadenosine tetraphosphate (Ap4A) HIT family hydrolase